MRPLLGRDSPPSKSMQQIWRRSALPCCSKLWSFPSSHSKPFVFPPICPKLSEFPQFSPLQAAQLVCSLSRDRYGVRTTQFVVKYISSLKSQVTRTSPTLCAIYSLIHLPWSRQDILNFSMCLGEPQRKFIRHFSQTFRYHYNFTHYLPPSVQVAYAAQTLCMHPASHLALRNMVLFREAWAENVQLLLSSLEALAPLTQFMSVVGRSVPKLRSPYTCLY